jgi:hypothetical protein
MIFFSEAALLKAVREFVLHFHAERNHQGLSNRLMQPGEEVGRTAGEVVCRERLGGMLPYYHRKAAWLGVWHVPPCAMPCLGMRSVHVMAPASTAKERSEHCGRPPLETEILLNDCRPK